MNVEKATAATRELVMTELGHTEVLKLKYEDLSEPNKEMWRAKALKIIKEYEK